MTDNNWERILEKNYRRTKAVQKQRIVTEILQSDNEELHELQEKYGNLRIK